MRKPLLAALLLFPLYAQAALPKDVSAYLDRRDTCEHLSGEVDTGAPKSLIRAVNRACKGLDKQLARLKAKYKDNRDVLAQLEPAEAAVPN